MNSIKFWLGLWSGKAAVTFLALKGNKNDDRPGILARRFDEFFLEHANKPEHVLLISGTNGKSSVTNIINSMYRKLGIQTACNDSGRNTYAGESWTLLNANNIFNRPIVDAIIMEADELNADVTFPQIRPTHLLITNLGRDSMFKNANPEIPYSRLSKAIEKLPDTKLILNGNDPLSCFLGENNKRAYYGVADLNDERDDIPNSDFSVCPVCGAVPVYEYRNYRHIGRFHCPKCGLKSPEIDYLCVSYDDRNMIVKEKDGEYSYPLVSGTIYNIYNETGIIAYFRELNYAPEKIAELLKDVRLPQIREEISTVNNIEVIRRAMKGQNAYAASSVLQALVKAKGNKEIVMMLDEIPDETGLETICWIWDTSFEYLKDESIRKIIVSGKRHLDHKVRLLVAGIDENKLVTVENDDEIYQHLIRDSVDKIYILYDVMALSRSRKVTQKIMEDLKG